MEHKVVNMSMPILFGETASTKFQLLVQIMGKKSCNLALHVLALFSHELISTAYGGRCKFSGVGIKERSAWRFGSP
jgi:hypothetical protein